MHDPPRRGLPTVTCFVEATEDQNFVVTVDRNGWCDWRIRLSYWMPEEGGPLRSWTSSTWTKRGGFRKAKRIYSMLRAADLAALPPVDDLTFIGSEDDPS
jgi:hypothetical protein